MDSQKARKPSFSSFRRKPESSVPEEPSENWTPFFNGVTIFCEAVKLGLRRGIMMKEALTAMSSQRLSVIVLIAGVILAFADLSWGKSQASYSPYPIRVYGSQSPSPGIDVSRRQQGSSQMDDATQQNWKRYQGLSPDDKAGLREKERRWQSLPPEERQEMRRRMERYRELPPQDQERYQKRYQQWHSLPPEDRNQIRDRLRNWDSLSPQEQQEIRQRFQKR